MYEKETIKKLDGKDFLVIHLKKQSDFKSAKKTQSRSICLQIGPRDFAILGIHYFCMFFQNSLKI